MEETASEGLASEILPMLGRGGAGAGYDDRGGDHDDHHHDEDAHLVTARGAGSGGSSIRSSFDGVVSISTGPFAPSLGGGGGDGEEMGRTPAWNLTLNSIMYMAVPLSMPATLAAAVGLLQVEFS